MIPIRDNQPSPAVPIVTYSLIGLNIGIFLLQFLSGLNNTGYFYLFGLLPGKYTLWEVSRNFSMFNHIVSPLTYMFLHGSLWHLIGNMWSLYIFGDNIEAHFGFLRFLFFYIFCGLISGFFHFLLNLTSIIPTIGASGAIAGVMGAYFFLFPRAKILTFIPIIIVPIFFQIPAFVFLGIWFFMQLLNAAGSQIGTGIAWWAHVGGFLTGLIIVRLEKNFSSSFKSRTREINSAVNQFRRYISKKSSPRLQVITPRSINQTPNLYGEIEINSIEALSGTKKMITVPWGFYNPLYQVNIPPGVCQGTKLRLAGMGKTLQNQPKGDLLLTINIKNII